MRRALVLVACAVATAGVASAEEKGKALVFRWDAVAGAAHYDIEIAEDREFKTVVVRDRVKSNYFKWQSLARRAYYWRVKAIEANGREGVFSEVRVIGAVVAAPALDEPADGAKLAWADQAPKVTLRWQRSELLAKYRVEVARDASFSGAQSFESRTGELAWQPTELGKVHWRVSGVDLNGEPVRHGGARSFEVVAAAPEPTSPRGAVITWDAEALTVKLAWKARPVKSYVVEVAADKAFKKVIWRGSPSSASASWKPEDVGHFFWRVRGASPETDWSKPLPFTIALGVPALAAPDDGATIRLRADATTADVALSWSAVPKTTGYVVTAGGALVRVEGTSATVTLPAGEHVWSVRATAGSFESAAASRALRVEQRVPVVAAELEAPADGATVTETPVTFTWKEVPGAARYQVELATAADFAVIADRWEGTARTATLAAPGPKLHWRVRALDDDGVGGPWSPVRAVTYAPPVAADTRRADTRRAWVEPILIVRRRPILDLAPEVGLFVHPGGVVAPAVGVEAGVHATRSLRVLVSARFYTTSDRVTETSSGLTATGRMRAIPIWLAVAYDLGPVYAGAGATLAFVHATADVETQPMLAERAVLAGGVALAGAELRLGPGRGFLQIAYGLSQAATGVIEVDLSGVTGTVGYRWEVW